MNDIYEKKAKKYKYKYLKLKKIFIGGEDDQKFNQKFTIVKYATQTSKKNEWLNAKNWQIELIRSCDENNENCNSIGKCGKNTYIYIKSMQEIINITNIKYRKKCLKIILPEHNGTNNIDTENLNTIKKIISENKLDSDYINIKNKNIDYDDYHYLYYIQSNIANEWHICKDKKVWIKNILPSLFQNKINNENLLKYLSLINKIEIQKYLLFKYNDINYISFIFEDNEKRIQFTIINLSNGNGNSKNVLYPQPKFLNLYKNKQKIINIQKFKEEIQKFYKLQIPILELNCSRIYIKNPLTPKVKLTEDVKEFLKMSENKKKLAYLIYKLIIFANIIKILKKEDEDREEKERNKKEIEEEEKRKKKEIEEEKEKRKKLREDIKQKSEEQKQNEKINKEIEQKKKQEEKNKKQQEEQKKKQEEKNKKQQEEKNKKQEQEKQKQEEKNKKQQEEKNKKQEQKKKQEEKNKKQQEEKNKKQQEEQNKKQQEEQNKKQEQEKQKQEEKNKKQQEEKKQEQEEKCGFSFVNEINFNNEISFNNDKIQDENDNKKKYHNLIKIFHTDKNITDCNIYTNREELKNTYKLPLEIFNKINDDFINNKCKSCAELIGQKIIDNYHDYKNNLIKKKQI
jgi:hypothetical protein